MHAMTATSERIAEATSQLGALTGKSYRLSGPYEPTGAYGIYVTDSTDHVTRLFTAQSYYAAKRYLEHLLEEEERRA